MELKLKDLVGLLGTRTIESMEVYDERDSGAPVCVGGCGKYGDRVVEQIIPGVRHEPRFRVTAYLTVWLKAPDGPEYWDGE